MKCPQCGAVNPDSSSFCAACRVQLGHLADDNLSRTATYETSPVGLNIGDIFDGRYKILEIIGEGGMGIVYLAEQEKPLRRKVAIKIIKPGMDTKDVIARFESERQALAMMSHPNIAHVYDSGETDKGHPYFVMEYVPGIPITKYCDKYAMTLKDRLRLFRDVCDAIQHAHYKGIIHRDIKPGNILVIFQDNKHIPKIIDFGIAKALTGQPLTDKTLYTRQGIAIGTPAYMSPEQAELTGYDIDTRTDVYSLGVLLYELLVGVPPFDNKELLKAGLIEILRIIREVKPPKPITKFKSLGDTTTEIAKKRSSKSDEVAKQLGGDLECIVLKSLEKDRRRRYGSPAELAADIERYMSQEPILARPQSFVYRMAKYVQRNKARALSMILFFLFLLSSSVLYNIFSYRNMKEKKKTEAAVKDAYYNLALVHKEKAVAAIKEKNWPLSKLFIVGSLLYQAKSGTFLPMSDLPVPFGYENLVLKSSTFVNAPADFWTMTPDGHYAISGGGGVYNILKMLDIKSGKIVSAFVGHGGAICTFSVSPDGKYLASGSLSDRTIKTWDIASGKNLWSFSNIGTGSDIVPYSMSFSPDNFYLAVGYNDSSIRIYDLINKKLDKILNAHEGEVKYVKYSLDGRCLVSGSGGNIQIWDMTAGNAKTQIKTDNNEISAIAYSADGMLLASTGTEDGTIKIWDTSNGRNIYSMKEGKGSFLSIDFSDDERYLAAARGSGTRIWDLQSKGIIAKLRGSSAHFHGNGIFSFGWMRSEISYWELAEPTSLRILEGHSGRISSICISPDSRLLATSSADSTIKIWDLYSGKELTKLEGQKNSSGSVAFNTDSTLIASTGDDQTIKIWDIANKTIITTLVDCPPYTEFLAFSQDGTKLVSATPDISQLVFKGLNKREVVSNMVKWPYPGFTIWDLKTQKKIAQDSLLAQEHEIQLRPVLWIDDSRGALCATKRGGITAWDLSSGKEIASLRKQLPNIQPAYVSPNGKYLVSVSGKVVEIEEADRGKIPTTISTSGLGQLRLSLDAKYLFSIEGHAGGDYSIRVWNIQSPREPNLIRIESEVITSIDITPDGKYLITGNAGGTIKVWDLKYCSNYLTGGLSYPYKTKDLEELLKKTEIQTGYRLDRIEGVGAEDYQDQGNTYIDNGDYNKAIESLINALSISPTSPSILNSLGWAYCLNGEYDEALKSLTRALEYDPWEPFALANIAYTYLMKGDTEKCYDGYVAVVKKTNKMGWTSLNSALKDVDGIIEKEPRLDFAYLIRGYIYTKGTVLETTADQYGIARSDLTKFLKEFVGDEKWKKVARDLLAEIGDIEKHTK